MDAWLAGHGFGERRRRVGQGPVPSDQGVQAAEEDAVAGGVPGAEVGCKGVEELFHRGLHGELEPDHLIGGDVVLQHGRRCGEQFTQEGPGGSGGGEDTGNPFDRIGLAGAWQRVVESLIVV